MTKIKIKMNHMIQYIDTPPHLLLTLYYVNHVILNKIEIFSLFIIGKNANFWNKSQINQHKSTTSLMKGGEIWTKIKYLGLLSDKLM